MYLLVIVLLFGGNYDEKVFTFKAMPACEEAMSQAREKLQKSGEIDGYWMACSAVIGKGV